MEPDYIDGEGSWTFPAYDALLKVAKAEERYANMYALNRGFFLWANSGYIATDPTFLRLSGENYGFSVYYNRLIKKFAEVFSGGLSSFTGNEPNVLLKVANNAFTVIESGNASNILSN